MFYCKGRDVCVEGFVQDLDAWEVEPHVKQVCANLQWARAHARKLKSQHGDLNCFDTPSEGRFGVNLLKVDCGAAWGMMLTSHRS